MKVSRFFNYKLLEESPDCAKYSNAPICDWAAVNLQYLKQKLQIINIVD